MNFNNYNADAALCCFVLFCFVLFCFVLFCCVCECRDFQLFSHGMFGKRSHTRNDVTQEMMSHEK